MQVQKAYDKVELTTADIQEAIRDYVLKKLQRRVRGHAVVNSKEVNGFRGQAGNTPHTEGGGFAYLEDGVVIAEIEQ
jgi:hypothetical protein